MFLLKVLHVLYDFHDEVQISWFSHPNCFCLFFNLVPSWISSLNIALNLLSIKIYIFLVPEFTMLFGRIWRYLMKEVMFIMTVKGELGFDKQRKKGLQMCWVLKDGVSRGGDMDCKVKFITRVNGTVNQNLDEELGFCSLTHRIFLDL